MKFDVDLSVIFVRHLLLFWQIQSTTLVYNEHSKTDQQSRSYTGFHIQLT